MESKTLAFPGDLLRQGGCANSHVPAAHTPGFWQRTCARGRAKRQSRAGLRSPQRLLLALEAALSGCQARIAAPGFIWIYRSTDRHAARGKDLGSGEGFSLLERINKQPLPLLSVSKLEGEKKKKMNPLSWHHGYRWSSGSVAACPLTLLCASSGHRSQ